MIGNWMISPRRAAYLRIFAANDVTYYRFEAKFAANADGIAPVWEDRHTPAPAAAVLSYPHFGVNIPYVLTGGREMLQKIAGVLTKDSKLFVRAASVAEIFDKMT